MTGRPFAQAALKHRLTLMNDLLFLVLFWLGVLVLLPPIMMDKNTISRLHRQKNPQTNLSKRSRNEKSQDNIAQKKPPIEVGDPSGTPPKNENYYKT